MIATIVLSLLAGAAPSQPTVIGRWRTETRNGIVEIARCGPSICGHLVTSDGIAANPKLADVNNKDAALRTRPLRGMLMLSGFTASDAGVWDSGTIYNAEDGKTYTARVTPVDADHVKVRGCIFVPLCKNQTWTRVR